MKKTVLSLMSVILLIAVNLYATDGNLIVEGDATIGGNVGIGTSAPGYKLTVQGAAVGDGIALLSQNGNVVTLLERNADGAGRIKLFDSFGNVLINFAAGGLSYLKATGFDVRGLSGESMFTVNPDRGSSYFKNGNVGIGTTNPLSKLAVDGLPNTPPDGSGTYGIVCITNDGNMWVDDDGEYDCQ